MRHPDAKRGAQGRLWIAVLASLAPYAAIADIIVPITSYEASETGLSVTAVDAGLTLAIVQGGVGGAPAATDGAQILKLTIAGEADRKVEYRHNWTAPAYSLDGYTELLADVYIESAGAVPDLMGIWSQNWSPPNNWQQATGIPNTTGVWTTISLDVASRAQTDLDFIWAFIFEDMAGTSGVAYVDNLRLRGPGGAPTPAGLAANSLARFNRIYWSPVASAGLEGYNIYRADTAGGPYTKLNTAPVDGTRYDDLTGPGAPLYFYKLSSVVSGVESTLSDFTFAPGYNGLTDDEMMDMIQEDAFRYFWDGAHPGSGMAREGINTGHPATTVTTGGTGFGIASIVVGAERGFITRAAAAARLLQILDFLENDLTRYHGVWAHWNNGSTGATIAFAGAQDNGGDLVETAFLIEGMLIARQYFDDPNDPIETDVRARITRLWEEVEWDWYLRFPGGQVLYWHWSPNFGWALNHQIRGFNEAQIIYLLAIASPTHPIPPSAYHNGWANSGNYVNGNTYFGYQQWVGQPLGGPLFFTHYSNIGFDPRYKHDSYANYFENNRNISLINRAHCIDNPNMFEGYSALIWGLTASRNPSGYSAHSPTNDNGTITPTAALSATAYTPEESLATLRHMFDVYPDTYGTYGFYDAFNLQSDWVDNGWLAIDQGPIAPMIENHRTGLCWKLFMANPEIGPMMASIGMYYDVDYDNDGDVGGADLLQFSACLNGPDVTTPPPGCDALEFELADLDEDGDVDMADAAVAIPLMSE